MTTEESAQLKKELAKIRAKAVELLARREHSFSELQQKLISRGYVEELVTEVVESLKAKGLQSDERYAEAYVRMRSKKGFGPVRIGLELQARGLTKETIGLFLDDNSSEWLEIARQTRLKKFGAEVPSDYDERAKQSKLLQYKGFTAEQIKQAFDEC